MAPLIDDTTRAVFCRSVGNPAGNICGIEALARLAHSRRITAGIEEWRSPRPFCCGRSNIAAPISLSTLWTKFIGSGHGVAMGGAIVDSGGFKLGVPGISVSHVQRAGRVLSPFVYVDTFGREAFVARARSVYQRTTGAVLAPMSAFLILQGIETVALRVRRHVENAWEVAHFLRANPAGRLESIMSDSGATAHISGSPGSYLGGSTAVFQPPSASLAARRRPSVYDALKLVACVGQHQRSSLAVLPCRNERPISR